MRGEITLQVVQMDDEKTRISSKVTLEHVSIGDKLMLVNALVSSLRMSDADVAMLSFFMRPEMRKTLCELEPAQGLSMEIPQDLLGKEDK